jgi:hypothetical protein
MSTSIHKSIEDFDSYSISVASHLKNTKLNILRSAMSKAEGFTGYAAFKDSREQNKTNISNNKTSCKKLDIIINPDDLTILHEEFLTRDTDEELEVMELLEKNDLYYNYNRDGSFSAIMDSEEAFFKEIEREYIRLFNYTGFFKKIVFYNGKKYLSLSFPAEYLVGIDLLYKINGLASKSNEKKDYGPDKNKGLMNHIEIKNQLLNLFGGGYDFLLSWKEEPKHEYIEHGIGQGLFECDLLIPFDKVNKYGNTADFFQYVKTSMFMLEQRNSTELLLVETSILAFSLRTPAPGLDSFVFIDPSINRPIYDGKFDESIARKSFLSNFNDPYNGIESLTREQLDIVDHMMDFYKNSSCCKDINADVLPIAHRVMKDHAYFPTGIIALFGYLQGVSKINSRELRHIARYDAALWTALCYIGKKSSYKVDCAAYMSHYYKEREMKTPFHEPFVDWAVVGLKSALKIK